MRDYTTSLFEYSLFSSMYIYVYMYICLYGVRNGDKVILMCVRACNYLSLLGEVVIWLRTYVLCAQQITNTIYMWFSLTKFWYVSVCFGLKLIHKITNKDCGLERKYAFDYTNWFLYPWKKILNHVNRFPIPIVRNSLSKKQK